MKRTFYIATVFIASLTLSGCGDGVELPALNVETDLDKIPLPEDQTGLEEIQLKPESEPFKHGDDGVYALHTQEDFDRIRERLHLDTDNTGNSGESPWKEGYVPLRDNNLARKVTTMNCAATPEIVRGAYGEYKDNYMNAAKAAARAYQLGLRWKIEKDDEYAQAAVELLNSWASTAKAIIGNSNKSLAAGIYGYQFAIAGEILRTYDGWAPEDFKKYQDWMLNLWYPENKSFLEYHHGANDLHYWANWGLCNVASTMAIGILTDRRDIYNEGVTHFQTGKTNGRLSRAIYHDFPGTNYAQLQESGRDQGHTLMCVGLLGIICQLTYNQGDDFFAYKDNLFLKACEYAAAYNYAMKEDLPFVTYVWQKQGPHGIEPISQEVLGAGGRGDNRPILALPYYHYLKIKEIPESRMENIKIGIDKLFPEGGGNNYGPNSGGYDALGFGTLMYAR